MACTAQHGELLPRDRKPARPNAVAHRRGILRRVFDAVYESRLKHAEREIARFVERSGGRITDDVEFQMSQRFMKGDWNARR